MVPFECLHGGSIKDLIVEAEPRGTPVDLPEVIDRQMADYASQSSMGSVCLEKAKRDLSYLMGKGRTAVELFKRLLLEARSGDYDLAGLPQLSIEQITRMVAMTEKSMSESKSDLEVAAGEVFGEDGRLRPEHTPMGRQIQVTRTSASRSDRNGQQHGGVDLGMLGAAGSEAALRRLRLSQEHLASDNLQFDLVGTRRQSLEPPPPLELTPPAADTADRANHTQPSVDGVESLAGR